VGRQGLTEPEHEGETSAKYRKLVLEANIRAEHQALARTTMLDLCSALNEANARLQELEQLYREEQNTAAKLSTEKDAIEKELNVELEREEKRKAAHLVEKALASRNRFFFQMIMAKSREAYPVSVFDASSKTGESAQRDSVIVRKVLAPSVEPRELTGTSDEACRSGDAEALGETGVLSPLPDDAGVGAQGVSETNPEDATLNVPREFAGPVETDLSDVVRVEQSSDRATPSHSSSAKRQRDLHHPNTVSNPTAMEKPKMTPGDTITFTWSFKLWWQLVVETKRRIAEEAKERDRLGAIEEQKRLIREAQEKAVEEMKKYAQDLEERLKTANENAHAQRTRISELDEELAAAWAATGEREAGHRAAQEAMRADLVRSQQEISNMKGQLLDAEKELESAQDALRNASQEHENDKKEYSERIRTMGSELQQALVLARFLREEALKAKRDAATSVSPAKFAQLVAQLEDMKNELGALFKDCNTEKESNAYLRRQLDQNRRQLEMERQFLPLLHKVRGPVGPGNSSIKKKVEKSGATTAAGAAAPGAGAGGFAATPPLAGPLTSPKKLRLSQSMGNFGGPLEGGLKALEGDRNRYGSGF